ncbi:MAG: Trm112 family protein [Fimbriimonadaceae bacterium]
MSSVIDPDLLAILACPLCDERPPLELLDHHLVCTVCGSRYPIEDGIPRLLPEDAIPPSESGV